MGGHSMSRFLRWSFCALLGWCVIGLSTASAAKLVRTQLHQDYQPGANYSQPPYGESTQAYQEAAPGYNNVQQASCGAGCSGCGDCYGNCGDGGCYGGGCGGYNCGSGCGDCGCGSYYGDCGSGCGCGPSCGCGSCDGYCDSYCGSGCDVDCGIASACAPGGPKWSIFGEYLYLQVTDADVTHAQQQDGLGGAGTVPFGEIASLGQDFNSAYRVGGMIACGPCSGVSMSYTRFDSDSSSSLDAPSIPGGGGAVGSFVHHPGTALTASAGPVDAHYGVDFQLADAMCRTMWKNCATHTLAWSLGAQFAHLDQDFLQSGNFGGGLGGDIDTRSNIDFDGGGIKIGVDGERRGKHGLGAYGKLSLAAMTGRFSGRYSMYNQSTDQYLAEANWKDDRVIGQFEYEAGVSLTSKCGHWRTTAGYMFSYWTNTVTTSEYIDAVKADNYTDVSGTLGFNGLVGRVECLW